MSNKNRDGGSPARSAPSEPAQPDVESDIGRFGALLWKRRWIILPFVILLPIFAFVLATTGKDVYESSSSVLLNRQSQSLSGLDSSLSFQPDRVLRTQGDIARLPAIANRVIAAAGLGDTYDAQSFLADSSVDANDQIDILTFRVRAGEPEQAMKLATLYASQYIAYARLLDTRSLREASGATRRQLASLSKQGLSVNSNLYGVLAERLQQLEAAQTLQKSNVVLVGAAASADHVEPQPRRAALLGLALALLLALAVVYVVDRFDSRVRTPESLAGLLDLRLLSSLPEPPAHLQSRGALAMLDEPNGSSAELIRMLRISLGASTPCRSIMVTSPLEGDGKTTTVANLALAFARAGKRVALVDLDLRAPGLTRLFHLREGAGITDVIVGSATLANVGHRIDFGGHGVLPRDSVGAPPSSSPEGSLTVFPSGMLPQNPGEFVASSGVAQAIGELTGLFDLVLIDGPPLLVAGDARVLGSTVEGVVLVARSNSIGRRQVAELERVMGSMQAVKLGLVVTGSDPVLRVTEYGAYGNGRVPSPSPGTADTPVRKEARPGHRN